MKKIYTLVFVLLSLFLISCTKENKNENGCFSSIDDVKSNALKNNQDILLIISTGSDDPLSKLFIENVINTKSFKSGIAKKYSVLYIDFSEASYQKTVVNPDDDEKTRNASEEYAKIMFENARIASMLNVRSAPAVFLFTKEMYCVTEIDAQNDINNTAELEIELNKRQDELAAFKEKVAATDKGTLQEKVEAIDSLFEMAKPEYKVFLADLFQKVIELDKNNETGLLSKYLLANANAVSSVKFIEGKVYEAIDEFIKVCDNKYLSSADRQQSYYMAAYLLAMARDTDFNRMLDYAQKSIDADPESEEVPGILLFKQQIESIIQAN